MSLISEALTRWLPMHNRAPSGRLPAGESEGAIKTSTPGTINKGSSVGPLIAYHNLGEPVWAPRDYAAFAREGFMQNAIVYPMRSSPPFIAAAISSRRTVLRLRRR